MTPRKPAAQSALSGGRGVTVPRAITVARSARRIRIPVFRRPTVGVRVAVVALTVLVALHCGVTVALLYRTGAYVWVSALPVHANDRQAATAALAHTALIWGGLTLLVCVGVALALRMSRLVQRFPFDHTVDRTGVRASSFVE